MVDRLSAELAGRGSDLRTLRRGHAPALEGQYLDVTSVPPGRYLLVHRANPDRSLEESAYDNNAASVLIQLRRTTGVIPAVRVLARCPDSETCSA